MRKRPYRVSVIDVAQTLSISLAVTCLASVASAQWSPQGVHLTPGHCEQSSVHACSGPDGSAYFVWRDDRNYATSLHDVFAQRILSDGHIAPGWPAAGRPIAQTLESENTLDVVSDGIGGLFVLVRTLLLNGNMLHLRRISPSSEDATGWPSTGVHVVTGDFQLTRTTMCSDGLGGAFVVWQSASQSRIQHIASSGEIAPGWPATGKLVVNQFAGSPQIVADGVGGVLVIVLASQPDGFGDYAIRLAADGSVVPGWPTSGRRCAAGYRRWDLVEITPDGGGGAFLAWTDGRTSPQWPPHDTGYFDIYAQWIPGDGTTPAGWPISGLPVCTANSHQGPVEIEGDHSGGAILVWQDMREGTAQPFGTRITTAGEFATGWTSGGSSLSTRSSNQVLPRVAPDGAGGLIALWSASESGSSALYAQHVVATGELEPGWPPAGREVASLAFGQYQDPVIAHDGAGSVTAGSMHYPVGNLCARIVAHSLGADVPVPVELALADALVELDRVTLRWFGIDAERIEAEVERRSESGTWRILGRTRALSRDLLEFVDEQVPAGRHAYRLAYYDGSQLVRTNETWLEVAGSPSSLSLAGFQPNPAFGSGTIAFTLPDAGPARLSVHDGRGRLRFARDVGSLGAGDHALRLDADLPVGVYWIRLERDGVVLSRRGVVIAH